MTNLLEFLKRNRYTASLAVVGAVFVVSSCTSGFTVEACFSDLCQNQDGSFQFGENFASPVRFERNLGQAAGQYDFISHAGPTTLLLSSKEVVVHARATKKAAATNVRAEFVGAKRVQAEGLDPVVERTNYLLGKDSSKWITGVPNFEKLRFRGVYPGIDVVYYGAGAQLEHDFVIAAGADPAQIRMRFTGAGAVKVNGDGGLELDANGSTVMWRKPVLYQVVDGRRRAVEGRYSVREDGSVGFEVGVYDVAKALTIDPVLAFSTYSGGPKSESAFRVAVDSAGNAYYTGGVGSEVFPALSGSPLGAGVEDDALVVKLSADGKTKLYTTFIGGASTDIGLGIAVDAAGGVYIAGLTNSFDFPVTAGAFETKTGRTAVEGTNCFVAKLNNSGTGVVYASYLGGSYYDVCTGIGVDAAGNAYVTGATASPDFPVANAISTKLKGSAQFNFDAFVSKISPDGSKLLYSTYYGGSNPDGAVGIAVDSAGNAYVTGGTMSTDFPVTAGVVQGTFGGSGGQRISLLSSGDAFVAKFDTTGKVVYSTYLGGSKDDIGIGIAVDAQGNAYLAGSTMSTNFPLKSAFQTAYKGAGGDINYSSGDGFVAKLNATATALVYSSYIGGTMDDRASAIAADANGNAFVAGNTVSSDFPVTSDAKQTKYGGDRPDAFRTGDAFVAQIGPAGALVSATYLGGSGTDWAAGIAVDAQGGVVVAGGTDSSDFPTTAGSVQTQYGGASTDALPAGDAWVAKFGAVPGLSIAAVVNSASYAGAAVAPGEIVTIAGNGMGPSALQSYVIQNGVFGTQVSGAQFFFDGVPAPIIYLSAKQSAVVVPYSVAGKTQTQVTVQYNGLTSAAFTVPVVATLPGLFSADSSGTGQGAILNQDNSYNSASNAAARGSIVVLFGTGEGQTAPGGRDGLIAAGTVPTIVAPVSVTINGTAVDAASVLYAGEAPGLIAGVFQVNVKIPCSTPTGNVPIQVQIGATKSQTGLTVAVRNPTSAENYCPGS